jgi:hypothetical protein
LKPAGTHVYSAGTASRASILGDHGIQGRMTHTYAGGIADPAAVENAEARTLGPSRREHLSLSLSLSRPSTSKRSSASSLSKVYQA